MNVVQISGRLTRDPVIRHVGPYNFPLVELNVAVDDADGKWDRERNVTEVGSGFYKVEIAGEYGEWIQDFLAKGDEVMVFGSLTQFRQEAKEGTAVDTKTAIRAKQVTPLKRPVRAERPIEQKPPSAIGDGEEPF